MHFFLAQVETTYTNMWTCISSVWFQLNEEMSKIVNKVLDNYPGSNSTTEQAWDFIQRNVSRTLWSEVRFMLVELQQIWRRASLCSWWSCRMVEFADEACLFWFCRWSAAAGPVVWTGAATWWSWTAPSCCSPAPARTSRWPPETSPTAASVRLRPPTGPSTTWWAEFSVLSPVFCPVSVIRTHSVFVCRDALPAWRAGCSPTSGSSSVSAWESLWSRYTASLRTNKPNRNHLRKNQTLCVRSRTTSGLTHKTRSRGSQCGAPGPPEVLEGSSGAPGKMINTLFPL